MQSGITVSPSLHDAFSAFTSNPTAFALPINITGETLTPLLPSPIPFTDSSLAASLPKLAAHLDAKTPCYIALRRTPGGGPGTEADDGGAVGTLTMITYVPSTAPVRAKTLFASSRLTVVRELGRERFGESLFFTEIAEVLELAQESSGVGDGSEALTREERELEGIRRAEEEERTAKGTAGRGLMGLGGIGGGGGGGGGDGEEGDEAKRKSGKMRVEDGVREALRRVVGEEGMLVQLSINMSTEYFTVATSASNVSPSNLSSKIPSDKPSYTFYHPPSSTALVFIYCCPGSSKIRERMMYASSRLSVVYLGKDEGFDPTKRLEISEPDEISEQRLREELAPPESENSGASAGSGAGGGGGTGASKQGGFARPKRPGR